MVLLELTIDKKGKKLRLDKHQTFSVADQLCSGESWGSRSEKSFCQFLELLELIYHDLKLLWFRVMLRKSLLFLNTFHIVSVKNILFSRFSSIVTINIDSTWQTLLSTGDYQRTLQVNVYYLFTITRGSRGGDGSGEFVDLHLVFDSLSEQVLDMILLFFRELITPALLVHYFIWNTKFLLIK